MKIHRSNGNYYHQGDFELSLIEEPNFWVENDIDELTLENKRIFWDELLFSRPLDVIFATQGISIIYQFRRAKEFEERMANDKPL